MPKYHALNDSWCSSDGVHWEQVTKQAPWPPRLWFSAVAYRDRLWVLGGWSNNPSKNWGDVWHSKDGRQWTSMSSKVIWKARHEHSTYVFQDKIWVAGGHAQPLNSWSPEILPEWFRTSEVANGQSFALVRLVLQPILQVAIARLGVGRCVVRSRNPDWSGPEGAKVATVVACRAAKRSDRKELLVVLWYAGRPSRIPFLIQEFVASRGVIRETVRQRVTSLGLGVIVEMVTAATCGVGIALSV